jgi:hypothetical protein
MSQLIQCPNCRATLMEDFFNLPRLTPCSSCGVPLQVEIYPAFFRKFTPGQKAEAVIVEGESSCFYHSQKKAVRPCDGCGRFLCALCDCELAGQHFCPTCLDVGKTKGKIKSLDNHRTRYDSIALSLAIFPLLIFYFTLITAPMTLFVAIRYWKAPQSIVRSHRVRLVIAIVIALMELGGWTVLFLALATRK